MLSEVVREGSEKGLEEDTMATVIPVVDCMAVKRLCVSPATGCGWVGFGG